MTKPPRVFHKLILELYNNQQEAPKLVNQIFRGITNFMPGYWTIIGITDEAYELMNSRNWRGEFTNGLRRDHIISARDYQSELMSRALSYDEFVDLTNRYGQCVLCTKSQNPPGRAGYGNTYNEDQIRKLPKDKIFDTANEMSLKATKERAVLFQNLRRK